VLFVYPGTFADVIVRVVEVPERINVPGVSGLPGTFLYQFTTLPAGTPEIEKLDGVFPLQTVWLFPVGAGG
jgi:hypothetical protein